MKTPADHLLCPGVLTHDRMFTTQLPCDSVFSIGKLQSEPLLPRLLDLSEAGFHILFDVKKQTPALTPWSWTSRRREHI